MLLNFEIIYPKSINFPHAKEKKLKILTTKNKGCRKILFAAAHKSCRTVNYLRPLPGAFLGAGFTAAGLGACLGAGFTAAGLGAGLGAGAGFTMIGAGAGFTMIGAGTGFTTIGAGAGFTTIGLGGGGGW